MNSSMISFLRKSFFILVALPILFLFSSPQKAQAAVSDWQQSVSIYPASTSDFSGTGFKQSVDRAAADGANYVTLIIPYYQTNLYTTDLHPGNDTPSDASLVTAVTYIHGKGLKVMFKPHLESETWEWRANINPADRTTWFTNYQSMLLHYGQIAQTNKVEEYCLGAELYDMTSPYINSTNTQNWVNMIAAVRKNYSGLLTYSAQHTNPSEADEIQFWNRLDFIGYAAYFPLADGGPTPSVADIQNEWSIVNSTRIMPLAQKWNKPVLFTEIGYRSLYGANQDPWNWYRSGSYDGTAQANLYSALFSYWNGQSFMKGVHLWLWGPGGSGDTGYSPLDKPAEAVIKNWFTGTGSSGGGTVTASFSDTTSINPTSPTIGQAATLSSSVKSTQAVSNMLVDVEIYNGTTKSLQQFFANQSLSANTPNTYTVNWLPTQAGSYQIKVGVFSSDWSTNYLWDDNALTVTVGSGSTTPPPTTATINIWWPANGATVTGIQPFQAMLTNYSLANYQMYWQVDGGQLNLMSDSQTNYPHKESLVNVGSWNWKGNGPYTINFVVKNLQGAIITQKSITIYVG